MYQIKIRNIILAIGSLYFIHLIVEAGDECKSLKHLNYELFGTKTIYEDARKYLDNKEDLPSSFDGDTLESEHKDMLKDSCKPIVFYFIGRHSARFPDGEDIEQYNKKLEELKRTIKNQESFNKCPNKFNPLIDWTSKMQFKHDNLITHLGAVEERNIAKRFKRIYPEFFDTEKSNVNVGVTTKIRTAQTGMEFLKEVDNLKLPGCDFNSLPTNDVFRSDYNLEKILQDPCYKSMIENKAQSFLEFHKQCDKISGKPKVKDPLIERVKKFEVIKEIAEDVAKRLGIPKDSRSVIDAEVLESIYNMCKFENAMKDDSVWCPLFSKDDIQALEYIEDVNSYIKSAYGPAANVKQSCPLVKHLVESFQEVVEQPEAQRRSYFYFSHADPMKKLLATFGMFKDDKSFSESKIRQFERDLSVPRDRDWRSSLISPFSANMAFILYRCKKPGKSVKHKVLATVTERPVKLGGCKDTQCSSERFFEAYNSMKQCDLNKVCAKQL